MTEITGVEVKRERLHELDWLRILAFFLLILVHSAMPFLEFNFPVKNDLTDSLLTNIFLRFTFIWRLPLVFLIAGMGIWLASRKRTPWSLFMERSRRLLIPLLFCSFFISPLQGYLRALQQGSFSGNYLEFLTGYFSDLPPETFHLWFLVNLFGYCLVLIPIIAFLKSKNGEKVLQGVGWLVSTKSGFLITSGVFVVADYFASFIPGAFLVSWQENVVYSGIMLVGMILITRGEFLERLQENRWFYCIFALVCFPIYYFIHESKLPTTMPLLDTFLASVSRLAIIFSLLVLGRRYLSFKSSFLKYNNEAVYPYYLTHQTISVVLAFFVVQLDMGIYPKLGLILAGTVLFTWASYHFLIRPFRLIRPLFGLKAKLNKCT